MTGLIVFLYVFSHSFYLVGSFRNALGNSPQEATVRAFALMHGIAALGLFAGSLFLLLKQRYGLERRQLALCASHTHSGPVLYRNLSPLHDLVVDAEKDC